MAILYRGEAGAFSGATGGINTIISASPTREVLAGSLLVAIVATFGGNDLRNVWDTAGNEWQVDVRHVNASRLFIASSVLASRLDPSDTISFQNQSGSLDYGLILEEFSGVIAAGRPDVSSLATGSTTALSTGSTPATSQASELCVAGWSVGGPSEASFAATAPYTAFASFPGSGNACVMGAYFVASSTGAQSAAATGGTTWNWAGALQTYKGGVALPEVFGQPALLSR